MKIESARHHDTYDTYAISFSDGITIILDNNLDYSNMLSVGPDTYFIVKGKWPSGKNLDKRVKLSQEWINKNKNRYKKSEKKVAKPKE
jgi:hypothetical protein